MATKKQIELAWNNAKKVKGKNPDTWRRDPYGNIIRKGSYGTNGQYGWEVDHIKPKSKGGSDSSKNIQALHTKINRSIGNKYPKKSRHK